MEPIPKLPALETSLDPERIRECLSRANRRGRLPLAHWFEKKGQIDDMLGGFTITLASRPLLCHLDAVLRPSSETEGGVRIEFEVHLARGRYVGWVLFGLVTALFGGWVNDLFIPWIFARYWYPPIGLFFTIWIWKVWPGPSLTDGHGLALDWIRRIGNRLRQAEESADDS